MAFNVFKVVRLDSINDGALWVATFHSLIDTDLFARAYMENAKYDDCPAGYPILKVYRYIVDRERKSAPVLLRTYYPNAADCSVVEMLEV